MNRACCIGTSRAPTRSSTATGMLKIANFDIATFFDAARPQPLTSRVVTLWYHPPELLLDASEYGVVVDLWSTSCMPASSPSFSPASPSCPAKPRSSNCRRSSSCAGRRRNSIGRRRSCRT
ncbi:hypothetical protein DAI22_03g025650 [Oryza sativa Japonica Group]|nr:hypothetical protein DAI22_03g025650 [Oryza sativa Japonica Group]